MDVLDGDICYRAIQTRDRRFDGRLYTGVTSTGIYCRPICPARTPKRQHCLFFRSAAAAQEAGFRACLRCRPELSPEVACWNGTSNTVNRALALIANGLLDEPGASVNQLSERVGVGERQLRRLFDEHIGASPIAVAQTRRVLLAKQLIHDTQLPMSCVALAAGFGSIRRFNAAFQSLYGKPPRALRRHKRAETRAGAVIELRIPYRPPYDWNAVLTFLGCRAIAGLESVENNVYRRALLVQNEAGVVEVRHAPDKHCLLAAIELPRVQALRTVVAGIRNVFDVAADVETIEAHFSKDPLLACCVAKRPGLRAPGGWHPFEIAVRAVLGQQISVEAARQLGGRLVQICGTPANVGAGLSHTFPTPKDIVAADLDGLAMPKARKVALKAVAEAAIERPDLFERADSVDEIVSRLCGIQGIGPWTAQYIALRGIREPDAFPASDAALLRTAARMDTTHTGWSTARLLNEAERWRPWRAYAAQHLWAADSEHHART